MFSYFILTDENKHLPHKATGIDWKYARVHDDDVDVWNMAFGEDRVEDWQLDTHAYIYESDPQYINNPARLLSYYLYTHCEDKLPRKHRKSVSQYINEMGHSRLIQLVRIMRFTQPLSESTNDFYGLVDDHMAFEISNDHYSYMCAHFKSLRPIYSCLTLKQIEDNYDVIEAQMNSIGSDKLFFKMNKEEKKMYLATLDQQFNKYWSGMEGDNKTFYKLYELEEKLLYGK